MDDILLRQFSPNPMILLAVDLQRGFITEHSRHIVEPITELQHAFDEVIFTRFFNPDPSPFREILGYDKLSPGDVDGEFVIEPRSDAIVIERPHYTCVTALLERYLSRNRPAEVYVCGVATEACVLKTVADLFEKNIRTYVIADLCASDQDEHYHDIALELIAKLVGKHQVIHSVDVLQRIHEREVERQ